MVATVLSSTAVGALGIASTVSSLANSLMIGVGMTAAMITSMILGEQDRTAAEELVKITVRTALLLGIDDGCRNAQIYTHGERDCLDQ